MMASQRAFGRRVNPQAQPRPASADLKAAAQNTSALSSEVPAEQPLPPAARTDDPSLDQELEAWKRQRKSGFSVPWRQLSLMASLCFGIASFALPDSVSDNVQWLLFALMGISLYVGFSKRRREAKA